ncbi:hypothetical protein, partial [Vibrio cholerae]|uniref:hypothetical protein n=1 Tax=Vibrio cholerae TaxID=666 RepID=UPI001964D1A3
MDGFFATSLQRNIAQKMAPRLGAIFVFNQVIEASRLSSFRHALRFLFIGKISFPFAFGYFR